MSKKRKKLLKKWAVMVVFYSIVTAGLVYGLAQAGNPNAQAIMAALS